jgi:hypothetical protein
MARMFAPLGIGAVGGITYVVLLAVAERFPYRQYPMPSNYWP